MSLTDVPIGLSVTNAGTGDATLQVGVAASLRLQVANNSGAAIALAAGADPATVSVYLPGRFFTAAQVQAMTVTADGWLATADAASLALNLAATQAGTWAAGATLTFVIAGAVSSGPPATDSATIAFENMDGDLPLSLDAPLAVVSPPRPGNAQLPDVLQVTLDSQGSVLRSASPADPLSNTLFLTLKNTGAAALATAPGRVGNPQVRVSFVYGSTSGALAPDAFDPAARSQTGSAWNILAGISSAQSPWTAANPRPDSQDPHPEWVLTPSPNNAAILGPAGGDQANVTFSFADVVSVTPAGHTQMLVLCTGFARDATTAYDDHLFVLDIVKTDAPPTRGLLSFFGPDPVIPVSDPDGQVDIPLRWAMLDVARVQLLTSSAAVPPLLRSYAAPGQAPKPLGYDSATVTVPAPSASTAIFCTLQAFDGNNAYLNSQQFTAYAQVSYLIDGAGHVYPVGLVGSTFWMLANYQFATASGSYLYQDSSANQATFGRLYTAAALAQAAPDGWSVPTAADWQALLTAYGGGQAAYTALTPGGRAGFGAQLGGQRALQPNGTGAYQQMYQNGFYWTGGGSQCVQFSGTSQQVAVGLAAPAGAALSVRLIRHA